MNCFSLLIIMSVLATWVEGWNQDGSAIIKIPSSENTTFLTPSVKYVKEDTDHFKTFCFHNVQKSLFQMWRSVQLVLLDVPSAYFIVHGANETEVGNNYQSKSFWNPSYIFSGSETVIEFPAFLEYCIGIATTEKYSLSLKVRTINYWKVLQMLLGVLFYLSSPDLSRNSFFHYASGIAFGVLASFIILLYIFSRFIPQKTASYAVLVFGYSFVLYFLKMVWHHFNEIITQYMDVVLGYCIVTAFLSFVVCYRIGPVKSERTCNLIQWSMQALSLILIFFSSEYRELSTAIILVLLSLRMIPTRCVKWFKFLWYRCFPPRIKFLTELEYIEQGHTETRKSLENLRQFCSSPDCNAWKVIRRLKEPVKFANFIETGNQCTDQELLDYNSEDLNEYPDDDYNVTNLDERSDF